MADPPAWTPALLQAHAQHAVALELFTIPAYLCAYHSIIQARSPTAADAAEALRTIANQEMMHLEQVSNLCSSLGCPPRLTGPASPRYPGRVPFNRHDVEVALGPATPAQIQAFMAIELPVSRDPYASDPDLPPLPVYETIGAFYQTLLHGLTVVYGDGGAPWPASAPGSSSFADDASPIADLASATAAIQLVIRQGEGASASDPHDGDPQELAHYYRFQAMLGQLGPGDLRPMIRNTAEVTWSRRCGALLDFFDAGYCHVLGLLEAGFGGGATLGAGVGLMWTVINALAAYVVEVPYQGADDAAPGELTLTPRYRATTTTPREAYAALAAEDRQSDAVQGVAGALGLGV